MQAAGWIESSIPADAGKTRKREYRVLPEGRLELARWATEPAPLMDLRDEFMVKLRADAVLGAMDLQTELNRRIGLHREKLAHYRDIEQRDFLNGKAQSREVRIHHMILKKGMLYEQGSIDWNLELLDVLG